MKELENILLLVRLTQEEVEEYSNQIAARTEYNRAKKQTQQQKLA